MERYLRTFLFILIIVFLSGCESETGHNLLLRLNLSDPKKGDVVYDDLNLDSIWQEIETFNLTPTIIQTEYTWIKHRDNQCLSLDDISVANCLREFNHNREGPLKSVLTGLLVEVESPRTEIAPVKLPEQFLLKPENSRFQHNTAIEYSKSSGISAYFSASGSLFFADLNTGNVINQVEGIAPPLNESPDLSLSPNGRLLLISNKNKSFLYSVNSGRLLQTIEDSKMGSPKFTKSARHIIYLADDAFQLLDTATFLVEATYSNVLRRHTAFDVQENKLISWGGRDPDINLFEIDEDKSKIIRLEKTFSLPESLKDYIYLIKIDADKNKALVLGKENILSLDLLADSFELISRNPLNSRKPKIIVKKDYIWLMGRQSIQRDRGIALIYQDTGAIALKEAPHYFPLNWVDIPGETSVLLASGSGLQKFYINPLSLVFESYEKVFPPKPNNTSSQRFRAALLNRSVASVPGDSNQIFKCRDNTGRISYSSKRCDSNAKLVETMSLNGSSDSNQLKNPVLLPKGKEGISQALRLGIIKVASDRDLRSWKSKNPNAEKLLSRLRFETMYVVLKPATFTGGLGGGNGVIFIVHSQNLTPGGDIGHSIVLFSDNGACLGFRCRL